MHDDIRVISITKSLHKLSPQENVSPSINLHPHVWSSHGQGWTKRSASGAGGGLQPAQGKRSSSLERVPR